MKTQNALPTTQKVPQCIKFVYHFKPLPYREEIQIFTMHTVDVRKTSVQLICYYNRNCQKVNSGGKEVFI